MKRTTAWAWVAAVTVVLSAGCASDDEKRAGDPQPDRETAATDFFQEPGGERVSPFARAQAANGARRDAMLYAHHFVGDQLNSLGRAKVLMMFDDRESTRDATVYLVDCRFDDSDIVLNEVKAWLNEKMPAVNAVYKPIRNVYIKDDPETWQEIQSTGHAAVVGVGH